MSFEVILPFLRPIEHLIRDGEISEIMVNGSGRIYIEKHGELLPIPDASISEKSLQVAVRNIARTLGDEVNDEMPLLDARLPDGSRVAAAIPPCSRRGTTLTIRKFQARRFTPEELVRIGTVTAGCDGPSETCGRAASERSHFGRHWKRKDHDAQCPGIVYRSGREGGADRRYVGDPDLAGESGGV